jgi:hypothetical protein
MLSFIPSVRKLVGFFFFINLCHAQNLVPNGNFESPIVNYSSIGWYYRLYPGCYINTTGSAPANWYVTYGTPDWLIEGTIYCTFTPDTAASGRAYIDIGNYEACSTALTQPIEPGFTYSLSFSAKREPALGLAGDVTRFAFNSSDTLLSPYITSTVWQRFEIVFTATAYGYYMELKGLITQAGTDIDSICLTRVYPLPVILTDFKYEKGNLKWATASEYNSAYFDVERNGNIIGRVPARGYSIFTTHYSFPDSVGTYYRLKQIDNDGAFVWSSYLTVARREEEDEPNWNWRNYYTDLGQIK